jgi:hypothetical protein
MVTRTDLQKQLTELDQSIDGMIADNPGPGEFWAAFAGVADMIGNEADSEQYDGVQSQLDAILLKHGKAAPEDLGPTD